jgi:trimeric autotransporter adhesin
MANTTLKKMRKYLLLTILAIQFLNLLGQDWLPAGNGTNNGGNGGVTLQAYNGKLIAGGAFTQAGNVNAGGVAMWEGTDWSIVDSSMNSFFAVRPLVIFQGQLYGFVSQFGDPSGYMIRLDSNFKWHFVPNSHHYKGIYQGRVHSATVYQDELYVAGFLDTIGGVYTNNIAKWDGTNWAPVGSGLDRDYVLGMAEYKNELYVGGKFALAGGVPVNSLAKWNGSVWSDVGGGLTGGGTIKCRTMEVYKDELYIGGDFEDAGGQYMGRITKWNGTTFSSVGGGLGMSNSPNAFQVYGNRLVMDAGIFPHNAGTWNGIHYDSLGTGLNSGPTDFEIYDCQLYAGGRFSTNGGAKGVAVLDTIDCSVGIGNIQLPDYSVSIYPNPFSSQTTLAFSKAQKNTLINITDVMGRQVQSITFSGNQFVIRNEGLKPGIYFVQIIDARNIITCKRIILQ